MREAAFLKQNAEKWQQFEKILYNHYQDAKPDELADLFIQLTGDLAYSRTYYPKSKTTKYLNELASKVHQEIYVNKKENNNRVVSFWKYELPLMIYKHRMNLLYSFIIFTTSCIIGAVSAANDNNFVNLIMGDGYVQMTIENIENNDPMAVYKKMKELPMSLAITINNIRVSFLAFAAGALASIGTGFILLRNGIMLGSFQYFFYDYGVLKQSLLTIWIHGTLEISAIIIAGAAGLTIGNSLLFPKTYSRAVSFRKGAIEGLKIIVGLVPIFIVAGFLEGFVTRRTSMPTWLSLFIIFGSLYFILWYFVYYPYKIHKQSLNKTTL